MSRPYPQSERLVTCPVVGSERQLRDSILGPTSGTRRRAGNPCTPSRSCDVSVPRKWNGPSWPDSARHAHPGRTDRQKWRPIGPECRGGRRTGSERERLYRGGTDSAQLGIVDGESSLPC